MLKDYPHIISEEFCIIIIQINVANLEICAYSTFY